MLSDKSIPTRTLPYISYGHSYMGWQKYHRDRMLSALTISVSTKMWVDKSISAMRCITSTLITNHIQTRVGKRIPAQRVGTICWPHNTHTYMGKRIPARRWVQDTPPQHCYIHFTGRKKHPRYPWRTPTKLSILDSIIMWVDKSIPVLCRVVPLYEYFIQKSPLAKCG